MHDKLNNLFFESDTDYVVRWENTVQPGRDTHDNMPHAHCMLDTLGYKCALGICYNYRFSSATVVTKSRFSVTLCVPCCLVYAYVMNRQCTAM